MVSVSRWLSEQPLDWPTAHIRLIDALREYIRSDEAIGRDLLNEGQITRAEYDDGKASTDPMREMLAELEQHEIDPTLDGVIKRRKQE